MRVSEHRAFRFSLRVCRSPAARCRRCAGCERSSRNRASRSSWLRSGPRGPIPSCRRGRRWSCTACVSSSRVGRWVHYSERNAIGVRGRARLPTRNEDRGARKAEVRGRPITSAADTQRRPMTCSAFFALCARAKRRRWLYSPNMSLARARPCDMTATPAIPHAHSPSARSPSITVPSSRSAR